MFSYLRVNQVDSRRSEVGLHIWILLTAHSVKRILTHDKRNGEGPFSKIYFGGGPPFGHMCQVGTLPYYSR
jgi:formylmethanofuran dehydrogenase subunit A